MEKKTMKFSPGANPEFVKKMRSDEQSLEKKMSQLNILKDSIGLQEAYKAVFGNELEIDETDDNV
jgi:hypothetical protein